MMTREDNELLCRIEGSAPMGQMMRRAWIPACLSEEVPDADGTPVAVRLFGEDLVAWRDSDGQVHLTDRYCPHRRASLVYARNEDQGLRCLYHGWKFDGSGRIIDMPSEPVRSGIAEKMRLTSYPTHEYAGLVWTYMGPRASMPDFMPPPFAPTAATRVAIAKMVIGCNWAQVLEGAIDSAHSSNLHSSDIRGSQSYGATLQGATQVRPSDDKAPRMQVEPTGYGFKYAAIRHPIVAPEQQDYVRITLFVAPSLVLIPPNNQYGVANLNVPIDDTTTAFYFIAWSDRPGGGISTADWRAFLAAEVGPDLDADYRPLRTEANRYRQDRAAMKAGDFSGIRGIPNQDLAMWETMGPIAERHRERLGASDQAIVAFRRIMVEAATRFRTEGTALGMEPAVLAQQANLRSFEGLLPKGADWRTLDRVEAQRERLAQSVSTV